MQFKNKKAQGMLEYALLLAIIVAVIVVMQIYVKRAVQGKFKQTADQIGEQFTTGETYTIETARGSERKEGTAVTHENFAMTDEELKSQWTISQVTGGGEEIGIAGSKDEVTEVDYVTANQGSGQRGTHGTFDSGKLKDIKLFGDDE